MKLFSSPKTFDGQKPAAQTSNLLGHLRRRSRHAWLLHGWLIAGLILLPCGPLNAGWIHVSDSYGVPAYAYDDVNENNSQDEGEAVASWRTVFDAGVPQFTYFDANSDEQWNSGEVQIVWQPVVSTAGVTLYRFCDLNSNQTLDAGEAVFDFDSDQDNLTNREEDSLGSDPLNSDTDHDGLQDGFEWTTARPLIAQVSGYALSLTNWAAMATSSAITMRITRRWATPSRTSITTAVSHRRSLLAPPTLTMTAMV